MPPVEIGENGSDPGSGPALAPVAREMVASLLNRSGAGLGVWPGRRTRVEIVRGVHSIEVLGVLTREEILDRLGISVRRFANWEGSLDQDRRKLQELERIRSGWITFLSSPRTILLSFVLYILIFPYLYFEIDQAAIRWMEGLARTPFRFFFNSYTDLGRSYFYILAGIVAYLILRSVDRRKSQGALLLSGAVAISGILVLLLKVLFARLRPDLFLREGRYGFHFFHLDLVQADAHQFLSFPPAIRPPGWRWECPWPSSFPVEGSWLSFLVFWLLSPGWSSCDITPPM